MGYIRGLSSGDAVAKPGGSAVMRIRLNDRQVEEVASLKGIRQAELLAGLDFGLTPDGDPIVLRDVGTQEIYSLDWYER